MRLSKNFMIMLSAVIVMITGACESVQYETSSSESVDSTRESSVSPGEGRSGPYYGIPAGPYAPPLSGSNEMGSGASDDDAVGDDDVASDSDDSSNGYEPGGDVVPDVEVPARDESEHVVEIDLADSADETDTTGIIYQRPTDVRVIGFIPDAVNDDSGSSSNWPVQINVTGEQREVREVLTDPHGIFAIGNYEKGHFPGPDGAFIGGYDPEIRRGIFVAKYDHEGNQLLGEEIINPERHNLWGWQDSLITAATQNSRQLFAAGYVQKPHSGFCATDAVNKRLLLLRAEMAGHANSVVKVLETQLKLNDGRDLGDHNTVAQAITTDSDGMVYVAGYVETDVCTTRAKRSSFVAKFRPTNNGFVQQWLQWLNYRPLYLNPAENEAVSIVVDSDSVYVAGTSRGRIDSSDDEYSRNFGDGDHRDIFIAKHKKQNGRKEALKHYGTALHDKAVSLARQGSTLYLMGVTQGNWENPLAPVPYLLRTGSTQSVGSRGVERPLLFKLDTDLNQSSVNIVAPNQLSGLKPVDMAICGNSAYILSERPRTRDQKDFYLRRYDLSKTECLMNGSCSVADFMPDSDTFGSSADEAAHSVALRCDAGVQDVFAAGATQGKGVVYRFNQSLQH